MRGYQRRISKDMPTRHVGEKMNGPTGTCGHVALGFLFLMKDPCPYLQRKERARGERRAEGGVGGERTLVLRSGCALKSLWGKEEEATREASC